MPLFIDTDAASSKSRLVHIALLNLNLRLMENWRSAQIESTGLALDYESLMIIMAIIVISSDKILLSELEPELQSLRQQLPKSKLGTVNLSSIAAATMINRESVRRKVNNLQKLGWVVRDEHGIRTANTVIPYEALRSLIGAQLDALTRTMNQLTKLGVLLSRQTQC